MTPDSPAPTDPAPSPARTINPAIDVMMEPQRGFNLRQFWHALLERIWIVALCVVAGLFVALGYLGRTPKTYQSHAVLEVDFQEPTFVAGDDSPMRMRSMFVASQEALRTIEQNLTNRQMLARVIRAEGLADDDGNALLGSARGETPSTKVTPVPSKGAREQPNAVEGMTFTPMENALAGAVSGMVKATIRRGTRLIDLFVTNGDPVMAQRLAEAVGREYIRSAIERRASFSNDTLRYLVEEEERLKTNLQKSESAVAEYKEKNPDALQLGGGTVATGSQTGSGAGAGGSRGGIVEDRLQDISSKLNAAKTDTLRLEGELVQIEQASDDIDRLIAIPGISGAALVNEARQRVTQTQAEIATLALRYKEKHPRMMAAKAALLEANESLRRAARAQLPLLRNAIAQSKTSESNLQAALHDQQGTALALNRTAIGYQELARQAESDRALYESVLRQIKSTDLTKDIKTNAVSIAEHAVIPRQPVSPVPSKTIMFGLLGGLMVGLAFVFGADTLDRSVRTVDQAEAVLGLPVLAAIPETKDSESKKARNGKGAPREAAKYRLVDEAPGGVIAEGFRNLRAALSLLGPEVDRRLFLFTSALPDEGKSFTSVNYALALAQQGHRVLLIDGDLRRPSIHKVFAKKGESEGAEVGVVDYLVGNVELKQAARLVAMVESESLKLALAKSRDPKATTGQLFILAGGQMAPNPAELLSGDCFKRLVSAALSEFDRVVVDSAPILAVSDTLLMIPHAQTTCMVVRAGKTPRNAINRAFSLMNATGIRPAGLVLNRLPRRRGAGYYYYYTSEGYGTGGGAYAGQYGRRHSAPAEASSPSGNGQSEA
jgi:succinoglycan biosynthesis transport protein ExoP